MIDEQTMRDLIAKTQAEMRISVLIQQKLQQQERALRIATQGPLQFEARLISPPERDSHNEWRELNQ